MTFEGMRRKIEGRTLRVDETKAKSTDLLESKIDEVKARGYLNVDERQEMEKSY